MSVEVKVEVKTEASLIQSMDDCCGERRRFPEEWCDTCVSLRVELVDLRAVEGLPLWTIFGWAPLWIHHAGWFPRGVSDWLGGFRGLKDWRYRDPVGHAGQRQPNGPRCDHGVCRCGAAKSTAMFA